MIFCSRSSLDNEGTADGVDGGGGVGDREGGFFLSRLFLIGPSLANCLGKHSPIPTQRSASNKQNSLTAVMEMNAPADLLQVLFRCEG